MLQAAEQLEPVKAALDEAAHALWTDRVTPELSFVIDVVERRACRLLRAWFFPRFRAQRLRKRLGCLDTASLEDIVAWAQCARHQSKLTRELKAIRAEHHALESDIGDPAAAVRKLDDQWQEASLDAVCTETAACIRATDDRLAALGRTPAGNLQFRRAVRNALDILRGWACTALSARANFPLEAGLFDLVIVDEASQCSLAAVLPLAYRAKRLAVLGDPSQLNPIVPLKDRHLQRIAIETGFDGDDLSRRGIHHKDGSAYFAFEAAAHPREPALLEEHYRCHPHIARWFNREFYNDKLTVLTEVAKTTRTIAWQDVDGAAERPESGKGWQNRVEAEQAVKGLEQLLTSNFSVGVVTPFAGQAQLVEQLAKVRFDRAVLHEAGFMCGTAHRLQGNERDAIVISAVLSPDVPRHSVGWVEKERNLLNVAVSRARSALIVLGHPDMGNLGSPTLASLRAYLRKGIARNEDAGQPQASFRTDSRSEELLLRAMQLRDLSPYAKLNVEGYELDFALKDQGIRLNIEVDGDQHLDARRRQRRQDLTRDRVLSGLGWTVLRISAWRCYEDIESVLDEITATRDRLLTNLDARQPSDQDTREAAGTGRRGELDAPGP